MAIFINCCPIAGPSGDVMGEVKEWSMIGLSPCWAVYGILQNKTSPDPDVWMGDPSYQGKAVLDQAYG